MRLFYAIKFNENVKSALAENLTVAKHSDSTIDSFVWAEMTRFFNGETSAEQSAKNLQSRLSTYLKE